MPFQRSFDVEAIQIEQARRTTMQNNCPCAMFALMSAHHEGDHVAGTRVLRLLLFLDLNATFRSYRDRIYEIHAVDALLERSLERSIAQQGGLQLSNFSVIANGNAFDIA